MAELFDNGYALIIGVGDDLPATVQDAEALHAVLTDPDRAGYPPGQVTLLTNEMASRTKVLEAMDNLEQALAGNGKENATVTIFYSGHGSYDERDQSRPFYLLTNGYQINDLAATAVSGREFSEKLDRIGQHAKKLVVLMDACHSGEIKAGGRAHLKPAAEQIVNELDRGSGRVVIASSLSSQVSLIDQQAEISVFTRYLIEALEGKNTAGKHPYVSFADVWEHLGIQVPKRSKELGREQTPVINVKDGTFFYLSRNAAGTPPKPMLYIDYAPDDLNEFVRPFEEQLMYLKQGGKIDGWWYRDKILFGSVFQQIDEHLKDCHIFIEMRGSDFLAYQEEDKARRANTRYEKTALETAIQRKMPRIPVILKQHHFRLDPTISDFQLKVYPEENGQVKPVNRWGDLDAAYYEVVGKIMEIIEAINA